jgi:hypothetical protein
VNGGTVRYIEFGDNFLIDADQEDAAVDSGLSSLGTPITDLDLSHLIGETVQILADGSVVPSQVVPVSGHVTIEEATDVHAGLAYNSNLETLPVETEDREGSAQNKVRRSNKVVVRFYRTIGGSIGQQAAYLDEMQFRETTDLMGVPVPFYTGDYEHLLDSTLDGKQIVYLRQSIPLPMTMLALIKPVWSGER